MNNESLKKFSQLPKSQRDVLSSPAFLGTIEVLGKQYGVKLIGAFVGLIVGDLPATQLKSYLTNDLKLNEAAAVVVSGKFIELKNSFQSSAGQSSPVVRSEAPDTRPITPLFAPKTAPTITLSFSREDEEEIEKLLAIMPTADNNYDYAGLAKEIALQSGIRAETPELKNRLHNIIIVKLKDVRDDLEMLDVLTKNRAIGGLGLSQKEADDLIKMIDQKMKSALLARGEMSETEKSRVSFPVKKPFQAKTTMTIKRQEQAGQANYTPVDKPLPAKPAPAVIKEEKMTAPPKIIAASTMPMLQIAEEDGLPIIQSAGKDDIMTKPKVIDPRQSPLYRQFQPRKVEPEKIPSAPEKTAEIKTTIPSRPQLQPTPLVNRSARPLPPPVVRSQRPPLDGVRIQPRLVGPVEELATMTLINFRRLGETPIRAVGKILEKINLLEKDSYGKRLEGIAAWHRSEVSRFYRLLGQTSMTENKSVEDIIGERLSAGRPTLSVEEFNEIMALNKRLRY